MLPGLRRLVDGSAKTPSPSAERQAARVRGFLVVGQGTGLTCRTDGGVGSARCGKAPFTAMWLFPRAWEHPYQPEGCLHDLQWHAGERVPACRNGLLDLLCGFHVTAIPLKVLPSMAKRVKQVERFLVHELGGFRVALMVEAEEMECAVDEEEVENGR